MTDPQIDPAVSARVQGFITQAHKEGSQYYDAAKSRADKDKVSLDEAINDLAGEYQNTLTKPSQAAPMQPNNTTSYILGMIPIAGPMIQSFMGLIQNFSSAFPGVAKFLSGAVRAIGNLSEGKGFDFGKAMSEVEKENLDNNTLQFMDGLGIKATGNTAKQRILNELSGTTSSGNSSASASPTNGTGADLKPKDPVTYSPVYVPDGTSVTPTFPGTGGNRALG